MARREADKPPVRLLRKELQSIDRWGALEIGRIFTPVTFNEKRNSLFTFMLFFSLSLSDTHTLEKLFTMNVMKHKNLHIFWVFLIFFLIFEIHFSSYILFTLSWSSWRFCCCFFYEASSPPVAAAAGASTSSTFSFLPLASPLSPSANTKTH